MKTLEGGTVALAKMGSTYEVNGAQVVCGGVHTANATVYIISNVLMPKSLTGRRLSAPMLHRRVADSLASSGTNQAALTVPSPEAGS